MTSEGSVYQRKDGRWVAQYRDAKDKVRYIYRKTKAEAKKALREALADRDEGFVPADKMTVGMYMEEWMQERKNTISVRTWKVQESLVRCRVKPHIGDKRITKLSPADVRAMYRRLLADGLEPSTIGRIHALVKAGMRDAVNDKSIRTNPFENVKPPKIARKEKDVLSPEELNRLLDAVYGERFECAYHLLALVGLRIGECLSLTTDSIDFLNGTVTIKSTLYNGKCSETKTKSSNRVLTLPKRALDSILRHLERHPQQSSGYLFQTKTGKPIDVANFYKDSWQPAIRKAGLPESITPHSLRHGTASLLLNQSVPVPVVSRYLGHANPGVTMSIYAHMIDGTSGMAASAMDDAL